MISDAKIIGLVHHHVIQQIMDADMREEDDWIQLLR